MANSCLKCGSEKLIPNILIVDQGAYSDGSLKGFLGYTKPDAWLLKGPVFAYFSATIGGECGFTELTVDDAALRYQQYRDLADREQSTDTQA